MNSYTDESGFDGVVPAHPIECEGPSMPKPMKITAAVKLVEGLAKKNAQMADMEKRVQDDDRLHQRLINIAETAGLFERGKTINADNATDRIEDAIAALQETVRAYEDALDEVQGCFAAAYIEGLADRMAEQDNKDPGSLTDLIQRRVLYANEVIVPRVLAIHRAAKRTGEAA